ncbi:MAG: polyphenol oxidase family protein [Actinomycetes bacterium]
MFLSETSDSDQCLTATSVFTSAAAGNFAVPLLDSEEQGASTTHQGSELAERRSKIASAPWTWLRQVHGDRVVVVEAAGQFAGEQADASVTAATGAVLCVQTADCAAVLFTGTRAQEGATRTNNHCVVAVGAAHAGWRGVSAGILQKTVAELLALGAEQVSWQLGPCISPVAYEFGPSDLQALVDRYGEPVRSVTSTGAPALDLREAVRSALSETTAVNESAARIPCTATDPGYFSWRARRDTSRQTAAIWMDTKEGSLC